MSKENIEIKLFNHLPCVAAILTTLLTVTPAAAEFEFKSNGVIKAKSENGDYEFFLGGRFQQDYNSYDGVINKREDETANDFFTRRARLKLTGKVKDLSFKLSYNLNGSGSFDQFHVRYDGWGKMLQITVGQQREFFGLEVSGSSKWITAVERSMPSNAVSFGKSVGVRIHGANNLMTYSLGAFQESIDATDNALDQATTGRLVFRPVNRKRTMFHIGAGFTGRSGEFDSLSARLGVRGGDDKIANKIGVEYDGAIARDLKAWNLELAAILGRYHFMAEYFDMVLSGAEPAPNLVATGYYVQVGWTMTGEARSYKNSSASMSDISADRRGGAWEVFARLDNLDVSENVGTPLIDIDGGSAIMATVGINWYASDSVKLAVNFVRAETDATIGGQTGGGAVVARMQYAF